MGVHEDLVRHKFIQSLHPSIAPVIATQKDLPLLQLADELLPFTEQCFAVQNQRYHGSSQDSSSRSNHSVRPFHENQRPVICRAHLYYGPSARTCRRWCKWPNKNSVRIQDNSRPNSPTPSRPSSPRSSSNSASSSRHSEN